MHLNYAIEINNLVEVCEKRKIYGRASLITEPGGARV
jgi:hypothetical protein